MRKDRSVTALAHQEKPRLMTKTNGTENNRRPALRNHIVPALLLRKFCGAANRLWMGNTTTGDVFRASLNNAFVEKGRYNTRYFAHPDKEASVLDFDGMIRSDECEQIISQIENGAAPVIEQIIESARRRQTPKLHYKDQYAVKKFILTMRRRTDESLIRQAPTRYSEEGLYDAIKQALAKAGVKDVPGREQFFESPWRQRYKDLIFRNADARYASGDYPGAKEEETHFCREFGLCVGVTGQPAWEFVIGSQGITEGEFKLNGLSDNAVLLPVAYDVVVIATRLLETPVCIVIDEPAGNVMEGEPSEIVGSINRATAEQSRFIGGRSEALVRTVVRNLVGDSEVSEVDQVQD